MKLPWRQDVCRADIAAYRQLNASNPTHQQTWTRKLTDPLYRGLDGAKLRLTLKLPKTNSLSFVAQQNEWRNYRGPRKTFVCTRKIQGSDQEQIITLELNDFTSAEGRLTSWSRIDQLGLCAHYAERGAPAKEPPLWQGPPAGWIRLEWA